MKTPCPHRRRSANIAALLASESRKNQVEAVIAERQAPYKVAVQNAEAGWLMEGTTDPWE